MTEANKTLYIPLYGKAFIRRKGAVMRAEKRHFCEKMYRMYEYEKGTVCTVPF